MGGPTNRTLCLLLKVRGTKCFWGLARAAPPAPVCVRPAGRPPTRKRACRNCRPTRPVGHWRGLIWLDLQFEPTLHSARKAPPDICAPRQLCAHDPPGADLSCRWDGSRNWDRHFGPSCRYRDRDPSRPGCRHDRPGGPLKSCRPFQGHPACLSNDR